jgi:hypothetical protein
MNSSNRMLLISVAVCSLNLLIVPAAGAVTQGPLTIQAVGTQGGIGYVAFTTPFTETCIWNNVYFNLTTDAGKATLSVLLTAHASGRPITRIDYSKDNQGQCWIDLVQL